MPKRPLVRLRQDPAGLPLSAPHTLDTCTADHFHSQLTMVTTPARALLDDGDGPSSG